MANISMFPKTVATIKAGKFDEPITYSRDDAKMQRLIARMGSLPDKERSARVARFVDAVAQEASFDRGMVSDALDRTLDVIPLVAGWFVVLNVLCGLLPDR